ncbi:hypothetical protein SAMN05444344_1159 [Tenacibaculum mesophilum]|nr:hypothetical protein SAMN05444344_1159 [Tenacibaculum mesophilum]
MGKLLLRKMSRGFNTLLSVLAEFGKGAGYALRH